jgi:hypothetical protein
MRHSSFERSGKANEQLPPPPVPWWLRIRRFCAGGLVRARKAQKMRRAKITMPERGTMHHDSDIPSAILMVTALSGSLHTLEVFFAGSALVQGTCSSITIAGMQMRLEGTRSTEVPGCRRKLTTGRLLLSFESSQET